MPSLGIDIGALSQRLAVAEAGRAAPVPLPEPMARLPRRVRCVSGRVSVTPLKRLLDFEETIEEDGAEVPSLQALSDRVRQAMEVVGEVAPGPANLVAAVPWAFSQRQRDALRTALWRAGSPRVRLADDTLALGRTVSASQGWARALVLSWGHGTLSGAVCAARGDALAPVAQDGRRSLGLCDVVAALATRLLEDLGCGDDGPPWAPLWAAQAAEAALDTLRDGGCYAIDAPAGMGVCRRPKAVLTPACLGEACQPGVHALRELVERLLGGDAAAPEGVVVCGAMFRLPEVGRALRELLGVLPRWEAFGPQVAQGAALLCEAVAPDEWRRSEQDALAAAGDGPLPPELLAPRAEQAPAPVEVSPAERTGDQGRWSTMFEADIDTAQELYGQGAQREALASMESALAGVSRFTADLFLRAVDRQACGRGVRAALPDLRRACLATGGATGAAGQLGAACCRYAEDAISRSDWRLADDVATLGVGVLERHVEGAASRAPVLARLLHRRAVARSHNRQPVKALEDLRRAVAHAPGQPEYEADLRTMEGALSAGRAQAPDARAPASARHLGRNDRCWCGSGRKFKDCHLTR